MTTRKSARPTTSSRPPAPQTHTHQRKASIAAAGTLGKKALTGRSQVLLRKPRPRESGTAGAPPPPAAGEHCSHRGHGRWCRGPSRPAARAAHPAAACHLAWSCPRLSAATRPGRRRPCTANTSHPPPRGAHPRSDACPRCDRLVVTGHPEPGHLPHHSGYSTGPLGACRGRAQVQGTRPSSW